MSKTTVSGLSSGAYMAGQFHFAHGSIVTGSGIVAGGPYGCAESVFGRVTPLWPAALTQNLNRAINGCMRTSMAALGVPNISRLAERARERASSGNIDDLANMKGDRVYLFAGTSDKTVAPSLVRKAGELFRAIGVQAAAIKLVDDKPAGHAFVTEQEGSSCSSSQSPYIVDCDYDQAGDILSHLAGKLTTPGEAHKGEVLRFTQDEFGGEGMSGLGALFVPETCAHEAGCKVHIVFHGCGQGYAEIGEKLIQSAGYNRWAAANRMIILYPQVTDSISNPKGCWDWWGYTGPKFLTREASQVKAVRAMLDRLAGKSSS